MKIRTLIVLLCAACTLGAVNSNGSDWVESVAVNMFVDSAGGVGGKVSLDVLGLLDTDKKLTSAEAGLPAMEPGESKPRKYTNALTGQTYIRSPDGRVVEITPTGGKPEKQLTFMEHLDPREHPFIWAACIAAFFVLENNTNMDMIPNFGRDNGKSSATKAVEQYQKELEEAAAAAATAARIAELEFALEEARSHSEP